jgi:hypothetical protein
MIVFASLLPLFLTTFAMAGNPPAAGDPPAETVSLRFPVQLTRNDGQWDTSIRFAILQQASDVMLYQDGIAIRFPDTRPRMFPSLERGHSADNKMSLRFVDPSPSMHVETEGETETVSHFYPRDVPKGGIEDVPNFTSVIYRNVWDGIDICYGSDGENLVQQIILRPGADASNVRFMTSEEVIPEFRINNVNDGQHSQIRNSAFIIQGNIASLPYIPGVLRDSVVLRTEFNTFFGNNDVQDAISCRVLPDGGIILLGQGSPPHISGSRFLTPGDSVKRWEYPYFIAGFNCDAKSLQFCTYFGELKMAGMSDVHFGARLQPDGATGFFLLCPTEIHVPALGARLDYPVKGVLYDTLDHPDWYTYLAHVTPQGQLTAGMYFAGVGFVDVSRTPDRGVLLAGNFLYDTPAVPGNFEYYTQAPAIEFPGMIMKLNERCDSVLRCVNLELLEDTIFIVSVREDIDGTIIIAGQTMDTPMVRNAWQSHRAGPSDVYLAKISNTMDSVLWATFLGGTGDEAYNFGYFEKGYTPFYWSPIPNYYWNTSTTDVMALDGDGGVWIAAWTNSRTILEMPGSNVHAVSGLSDILVAHFGTRGIPTMIRTIGGSTLPNMGMIAEYPFGIEVLPCGRALLSGFTGTADFPRINALELDSVKMANRRFGFNILAVYDISGDAQFSTYWSQYPAGSFRYDRTGHIVSAPDRGWMHFFHGLGMALPQTYNAFQPLFNGPSDNAVLTRQYLPLCGEDAISCSFTVPDTIRCDTTRHHLSLDRFPLDVTITNPDPARAVFELQCELRLPPGIVLEPDTTPLLKDVVPMLAPGAVADVHWMLRVVPGAILDSLLPITVTTHYRWADLLDNCLSSHGGCRAEIVYLRKDSRKIELECDLDAPDSIAVDAGGEGYATDRFPVTLRLRNVGLDPVLPGVAALRVGASGVYLDPVGDSLRVIGELLRGEQLMTAWQLRLERRGPDREVLITAEVRDEIGALPAYCETVVRIPGIPALRCAVNAPARIVGTAGAGFPGFPVELRLENRIDTLVRRAEARIDLSRAAHLRLSPGEQAQRLLGPVAMGEMRSTAWPVEVFPVPVDSVKEIITVWYWYQEDTTRRSCEVEIMLVPIVGETLCSVTGPSVLSVADSLPQPSPVVFSYMLKNSGNRSLTVDRYVLDINPGKGLQSLDPLTVAGGTLAPGVEVLHEWRCRPLALAQRVRETITVVALTAGDSVISECVHTLDIPSIEALRCGITVPDSVRFLRDSARYDPTPVSVRLDLRNVLDTEETAIEVEIDLAIAPRLLLAAGETRRKTLARIDSHSSATFIWLLAPQRGASDENQTIRIRYGSATPGPWKECNTTIIIEAWPEITEVRCATGGHDSLHADQAYEDIVPKPFQVSYTATNSGTVTLTNCTAAIILPVGFACAGSDSIQSYGSLAPGETAKRWWTLTTTDQLTTFGPKDIQWQWSSTEQGNVTGCTHTVQVVPNASGGIVFTPLHLYFEAELGGALPAAQNIELWTGGGLSMPWTAQSDTWYIDLDPVTGDHSATIAVRPNTTMLNKGMHESGITLAGSAQNLPKSIDVLYTITSLTGTGSTPTPSSLSLGPIYPHPIPLQGEARILITAPAGSTARITLHDLLGRERALLHDGLITDSETLILRPVVLGLGPGSYLLRLLSPSGMLSRMVTVVR